jgi:hypothetical protein
LNGRNHHASHLNAPKPIYLSIMLILADVWHYNPVSIQRCSTGDAFAERDGSPKDIACMLPSRRAVDELFPLQHAKSDSLDL